MSRELQYTIVSENENDYLKIHTCLEAPTTPITKLTITDLTTLCTIVVLDEKDYIEIDRKKYYINESYTNINSITLADIFTNIFKENDQTIVISVHTHKETPRCGVSKSVGLLIEGLYMD